MSNFNPYVDSLREAVENSTEHAVVAQTPLSSIEYPSPKRSVFTVKNILWTIGVCIIGISVMAFATQVVLLAIDNIKEGKTPLVLENGAENSTTSNMYVRADAASTIFNTDPDEGLDMSRVDLGIPGVAKIGFDANTSNKALTDNINKYAETTFVLGGRQGEKGGDGIIGGGDSIVDPQYSLLDKPAVPMLSSKAYLVADLQTGEVILEKNADAVHPLASVSKLMTALIVREQMDLQSIAIVSRDASSAYGGQGNLGLGEKIRLADLLFPLLMESSNDAAEVFADQYGHARFIEEMNKKAAEIGMVDTYYGDPSGLDPRNTASPRDLLKLARYIHQTDPQVYDMTRVKQFSIKGHAWKNANALLLTPGFAGGKNGYIDQSRQTTVSIFDVDMAKGGSRTVVVVVLRSENKNGDVSKLLNYLKKAAVFEVR